MHITYESVITTFIQCSFILVLIQGLLKLNAEENMITPKFLYGMGLLFLVRLIIPVDLGILLTISSRKILPAFFDGLNLSLLSRGNFTLTIGELLLLACLLVSFYQLLVFLRKNILFRRYLKNNDAQQSFVRWNDQQLSYSVAKTSIVNSPCISGIRNPVILLPEQMSFTAKELDYVILHELMHVKKKDTLLIPAIELFSCFYWWNPLLPLFKKQMLKIIELRVDNELLEHFDYVQRLEYAECLIKVKKEQKKRKKEFLLAPHLVNVNQSVFEQRFQRILGFENRKASNKVLTAGILLLSLFSMLFIIEPFSIDPVTERTTFSIERDKSNYIIKGSDGVYSLYIHGKFKGTIHDIKNFPDIEKLPIYRDVKER